MATEAQIGQVVCELTNMLCGSVLSRIEKDTLFDLSSPRLTGETRWGTKPIASCGACG